MEAIFLHVDHLLIVQVTHRRERSILRVLTNTSLFLVDETIYQELDNTITFYSALFGVQLSLDYGRDRKHIQYSTMMENRKFLIVISPQLWNLPFWSFLGQYFSLR